MNWNRAGADAVRCVRSQRPATLVLPANACRFFIPEARLASSGLPVSDVELTVQCCDSNTLLVCHVMRFIELHVEQIAQRCEWQSVQDPTNLSLKPPKVKEVFYRIIRDAHPMRALYQDVERSFESFLFKSHDLCNFCDPPTRVLTLHLVNNTPCFLLTINFSIPCYFRHCTVNHTITTRSPRENCIYFDMHLSRTSPSSTPTPSPHDQ